MLAGCPGAEGERGPRPTTTASIATPGGGDAIRFGVLGEPATLDPYASTASDLTHHIGRTIYPSLFALAPDGRPRPLLAADIEAEGQRATVRLASSASWSDGSPVTAGDVVASWRRARAGTGPSGFRDIGSATAVDPATVVFTGAVDDWEATLARAAYVLPGGRGGGKTAGPFRIARRTPGLEIVLEPDPRWFGEPRATTSIRIRFIRTTGTMLTLVERGELDAADVPSTVNLDDRVEMAGLEADSARGWGSIRLSFGDDLSRGERAGVVGALDLAVIDETLIRGDGRRATRLHPGPGDASGPYGSVGGGTPPGEEITLTAPAGDELLTLMLRAVYAQLTDAGMVVEASPIDPFIFYGGWIRDDPSDVSIRRAAGAPGLGRPRDDAAALDHVPLFHVDTYIVWRAGVDGPRANPTLDGPLWNAHEWTAARGS